ncbi:OspB [Pseudovibrio sp. Alg231-02]|uniref:OspB n=1 Tax=Pseudovibrio sp. Alg231-02 TaxID=1922223 RepID=UPI001902316A|nr:OspB [Pseudovibrio sp. Alg231-02]
MPISNVNTTQTTVQIENNASLAQVNTKSTQSSSLNDSVLKAEPEHKTGFYYAPFASEDVLLFAAGTNQARNTAGKEPRHIIVANDAAKTKLETLKQQLVEKNQAQASDIREKANAVISELNLEGFELLDFVSSDAYTDLLKLAQNYSFEADVLQQANIISNEKTGILGTLKNGENKIYVLGHGANGSNEISSKRSASEEGYETVSSKGLAEQLSKGGLDKSFTDIRVESCYSADATAPESFDPEELKLSSEPGFIDAPEDPELDGTKVFPFAQSLANELKSAGFESPEVAGYHGAGKAYSDDTHRYQTLHTDDAPVARSSDVRQIFIPV